MRKTVTTLELQELLAAGKTVRLPSVDIAEDALSMFPADEVKAFQSAPVDNPIVSVEYLRDDEVQCISVNHPDHMYITDDFIPTHNTSNIIFLKSTDDTMMDTLSKMSGERHSVYTSSKTITKDIEKLVLPTEGKASYTMSAEKEPVISFNDMAFISERNSIVFRAGDSPIWNRNQMIMPMSWIMFKNTINHPGHEYTLQSIPTLSSALDFDVRTNQPDFVKMLNKRMAQAVISKSAQDIYQNAYNLDDYGISMLDPDVYSSQVMGIIQDMIMQKAGKNPDGSNIEEEMSLEELEMYDFNNELAEISENKEMVNIIDDNAERMARMQEPRYAEGHLSQADLINGDGSATMAWDNILLHAYSNNRVKMEKDHRLFSLGGDGSLCSKDGSQVYISKAELLDNIETLNESALEAGSQVYGEEPIEKSDLNLYNSFNVHPEFYQFLASLPSWDNIASGSFDRDVAKYVVASNDENLN